MILSPPFPPKFEPLLQRHVGAGTTALKKVLVLQQHHVYILNDHVENPFRGSLSAEKLQHRVGLYFEADLASLIDEDPRFLDWMFFYAVCQNLNQDLIFFRRLNERASLRVAWSGHKEWASGDQQDTAHHDETMRKYAIQIWLYIQVYHRNLLSCTLTDINDRHQEIFGPVEGCAIGNPAIGDIKRMAKSLQLWFYYNRQTKTISLRSTSPQAIFIHEQ